MIYFITNRLDHNVSIEIAFPEQLKNYLRTLDSIGIDIEANRLDANTLDVLLISTGDRHNQFVIDATSVDYVEIFNEFKDKTFIGQNLKYDYNALKLKGFRFTKMYDTMIAEQTLGMGSGRKNGLDVIIERRLGEKATFTKDIRNEFIGMKPSEKFEDRHIIYSADDIKYLERIREVQEPLIKKYKMDWWLNTCEFPLISLIGDCETEGLRLDIDKWKENILFNKKEKYRLEIEMDKEIHAIGMDKLLNEDLSLVNGRFSRKRSVQEATQLAMFNVEEKVTSNLNKGNTNYGSDHQVKKLFTLTGNRIPTDKYGKNTTKIEAIQRFVIENPNTNIKKFCEILVEFKSVKKELEGFGDNFLRMINEKTGNIHTIYRQCTTETGRFSSGEGKRSKKSKPLYFNSQQIPKDNRYRHCFGTKEGYDVLTIDLAGAELIILASLANDDRLIELQSKDIHGHLASAAYNKILMDMSVFVTSRVKYGDTIDEAIKDFHLIEVQKLLSGKKPEEKVSLEKCREVFKSLIEDGVPIVINKKEYPWLRDGFKSVVYGLVYGATAHRISEVLNIPKHQAQIVVDVLRLEIPKTFKYLDDTARFAIKNGYVLLSTRTNSRRWFTEVLEANEKGMEIPFKVRGEVERAAKNARIQATNALIIKEAIVRISQEYLVPNNIDANLLLQVHDELVYRFPTGMEEFPIKIKEILLDTANSYLIEGVKMDAAYHIGSTWHK